MLNDNQQIKVIFAAIKADGYTGSYTLLVQYCRYRKPVTLIKKKDICVLKRKDLTSIIWSNDTSALSDDELTYINDNFPVFDEIKTIIAEFRTAYSNKDISAVKSWCDKYALCDFPPIVSFINGIHLDYDAFYNSLIYDYNNGLLEGSVNKLKTVKRSMFGRAKYDLLRAKMLLANDKFASDA
jgi:hypothetical protein